MSKSITCLLVNHYHNSTNKQKKLISHLNIINNSEEEFNLYKIFNSKVAVIKSSSQKINDILLVQVLMVHKLKYLTLQNYHWNVFEVLIVNPSSLLYFQQIIVKLRLQELIGQYNFTLNMEAILKQGFRIFLGIWHIINLIPI